MSSVRDHSESRHQALNATHGPRSTAVIGRRRFLQLAGAGGLAVGGAGLLAACGSTSKAGSGGQAASASFGEVSLALGWIEDSEFGGEYFASDKGYYTDNGFSKVTLLPGGGQTAATDTLLSGQCQFALPASPSETAGKVANGAPLKIIGASYVGNPTCLTSLAEKTPIRTPQELRGKKIGVQSGSQDEIIALLNAYGMTEKDVHLVAVQYDVAPLISGKVDTFLAYATSQPLVVKDKGLTPVNLFLSDYGQQMIQDHYVVTTDTLKNKRDMVIAFMAAEVRGWNDAVRNPEQVAAYAVTDFGKSLSLAMKTELGTATAQVPFISTRETAANGLLTISDSLAASTVKSLQDGYKIKTNVATLFDFTVMKDVYAKHPELRVSDLPTGS